MPAHHRNGYGLSNEEYEDFDEYEDEEEEEEEEQEEEAGPNPDEQRILELREKLKDQFRKKLRRNNAKDLGQIGQSQGKKKAPSDTFGSFFGPSKPVIAQRVLEANLSLEQARNMTSKTSSVSSDNRRLPFATSTGPKLHMDRQHPKPVNEVKKKAQTLKDMRDYSFLLSDDADIPDAVKEQHSAPSKAAVHNHDAHIDRNPLRSKTPLSKPLSSGHNKKSSTYTNWPMQGKAVPGKADSTSKSKLPSTNPSKVHGSSVGNGPGRPSVHKALPSKAPPSQSVNTNRIPSTVQTQHVLKKKPFSVRPQSDHNMKNMSSSVRPPSSAHIRHVEPKGVPHPSEKVQQRSKQPLASSRSQPPKLIRHKPEDYPKKKVVHRELDDDLEGDQSEAFSMLRSMLGKRYDPSKWAGMDDDDSDMEVGFDTIQNEERRSARIARKEDEEQLRLIEEEERRERERRKKKQRLQ